MDLPDNLLKCVMFIYLKVNEDSGEISVPVGTAFLVSFPSEGNPDFHFGYLVTAKHIVEQAHRNGGEIIIRSNTKEGGIENLIVPKRTRWFEHPTDKDVDVAIIPVILSQNADLSRVPTDMFLKTEDVKSGKVRIGNDVFITGLFTQHHGKNKNLPIARMGNIAMLEEEKISVKWEQHPKAEIDAYLIEARSIGGISGSPVFIRTPLHRVNEKGELEPQKQINFFLAGLIHGHWPTAESEIDVSKKEEKNVNMGIAIVIPAHKILEVLVQDEMKKARDKIDEQMRTKNHSVTDNVII